MAAGAMAAPVTVSLRHTLTSRENSPLHAFRRGPEELSIELKGVGLCVNRGDDRGPLRVEMDRERMEHLRSLCRNSLPTTSTGISSSMS